MNIKRISLVAGLLSAVLVTAPSIFADDDSRQYSAAEHRAAVRKKMTLVMGKPVNGGKPVPLDVRIEREEDRGRFIQRKLSYQSAPGERVPALLLIPKKLNGKAPAALCLHQTTSMGKNEPAGLGGLPNLHYALELAERGWVCLIPDYPTLGEHQIDVYKNGWQSGSMKAIWDNMRGIDLLQGLKEVDPKRIAAIGHSLGGHNSLFTAAFDSRIKCVVTSCGFTSFPKYYGGNLGGWGGPRYMPRIKTEFQTPDKMPFDFDDVLTAIAPNAVFISAPVRDTNFEVSGVDDVVRKAGIYYRSKSAGDRLSVIHPNCEHDWLKESREQAYRFMERWAR